MNPAAELELARHRMLREQLQSRGIHDRRLLSAMGRMPRERFVRLDRAEMAYEDRAWAIDCGQTISQPYIVALMTAALELSGSEHVLEIGTGSGYQTAILAELAHDVISLERHAALSAQAGNKLADLGITNVSLLVADGTQGWPAAAPYDRILVAAAAETCPPALIEQLAEGGVLVIPLGQDDDESLCRLTRVDGRIRSQHLARCRFVPLVVEGKDLSTPMSD